MRDAWNNVGEKMNMLRKMCLGVILCLCLPQLAWAQDSQTPAFPSVEPLGIAALEARLYGRADQLTLVYFWSTSCAPCVKHIHLYEALQRAWHKKGLRVLYVSLDDISRKALVLKLMKKKDLRAESVLYVKPRGANRTLFDVLPAAWSGAIPFVLFIRAGKILESYEGTQPEGFIERRIQALL